MDRCWEAHDGENKKAHGTIKLILPSVGQKGLNLPGAGFKLRLCHAIISGNEMAMCVEVTLMDVIK